MCAIRSFWFVVFVGLIAFSFSWTALAQEPIGAADSGINAYVNTFARPGQATMLVNVWGSAGSPGIWRVERNVDLIDFLSVVEVPGIGLDEVGTRSTSYVVIYRSVQGERRETYRKKVQDLLQEGARYPNLQPNDVLSVEVVQRRTVGLQLVSGIIGAASSLTLLIINITGN